MPGSLKRASLAATALCTLLVPIVGSVAGPQRDLKNTQQELGQIRERIEAHEARALTLRKDISTLNRLLTRLQIAMSKLDAEIAEVQSQVRTAQARIDDTQSQIDEVEDRATEQAVALYKTGGTDALDALLDADSLAELDTRIEMMGVAARQNTGALIKYGRLRALIREQSRELFETKSDLDQKLATKSDYRAELDQQRERMASKYAVVEDRLDNEHARKEQLEGSAKKIRDKILSAQVGAELAELGKSSQGFIWPVNGAVVSPFGQRWGRLHAGLDIGAISGQPIAAAAGGVIIYQGTGMQGYGNVIIIDHGGGIATLYAHQSRFAGKSGTVRQGEVIGYVGCTGSCYGDHLHFEVHVNGSPTDPMGYLP